MLNIEKINGHFKRAGEIILHFRWFNIALFILLLGISIAGLKIIHTDVNQNNWFLEDDVLMAARERFEEIFGNNDFCAVLVEADNVFTP